MKVKALKVFFDREGQCLRYPGSQFDASEERVAVLNGTKAGQLVEVLPEPEKEPEAPPADAADQPAAEPQQEPDQEPETEPQPEPAAKPKATKAKK